MKKKHRKNCYKCLMKPLIMTANYQFVFKNKLVVEYVSRICLDAFWPLSNPEIRDPCLYEACERCPASLRDTPGLSLLQRLRMSHEFGSPHVRRSKPETLCFEN